MTGTAVFMDNNEFIIILTWIHRPLRSSSLRSQSNFSFNFLLSPAKKSRNVNKGRKLKTNTLCALCGSAVNKILNLVYQEEL